MSTIRTGFQLLISQRVPRTVKLGLLLIFVLYVLFPIDIIPDFLPLIGIADEVTLLFLLLRFIVKKYSPQSQDVTAVIDGEIVSK